MKIWFVRWVLLCLVSAGVVSAQQQDEELPVLPVNFDVYADRWETIDHEGNSFSSSGEEATEDQVPLRVRGNRFSFETHSTRSYPGGKWPVEIESEYILQGVFDGRNFTGSFSSWQRNWEHGSPTQADGEYMRTYSEGTVTGRVGDDGSLVLTNEYTRFDIFDVERIKVRGGNDPFWEKGSGWILRDQQTLPMRNLAYYQLPVGQVQDVVIPESDTEQPLTDSKGAGDSFHKEMEDRLDEMTAETNSLAGNERKYPEVLVGVDEEGTGEVEWKLLPVPVVRNLLASGVAVVGAGLLMLGSGVRPREVVEGIKEILKGGTATPTPQPPSLDNDFEKWKQDYESRGWRYRERDGVAEFEPVDGATNENGWVYSEESESFLPPEGERPVAEPPPAEVSYKEGVRLLKEDLERQRDLLDRERERLQRYEEAGLKELVPGARDRVKEYEKLAELDEKELKRLEEDLPVHTREDNRDLESDTEERLRSRETIRDLEESEAKTEEVEDTIRDRATREQATQQAERLVEEKYGEFEDRIQEIIDKKTGEGYYVRNSNLPKKAWNNTVGRAIEWAGGWKGGQCGEYGKWGMDWSKGAVKELFGSDAIVTDISASNNPFLGHRATKVILPDGRRVVVDFWESMPEGKPKIYDEKEWIDRWSEKLWSDYLGKAEVDRHPDELMLKKYIGDWGEEAGKEKFRNYFFRRSKNEHAEILIRSWNRDPW